MRFNPRYPYRHPPPPAPHGEPPVTREFNRWFFGICLPGLVLLYSLSVMRDGYMNLPVRGMGTVRVLHDWDARLAALTMILAALLFHRIRFWYELYQSPPSFWKWYDQLLLLLVCITFFWLIIRIILRIL